MVLEIALKRDHHELLFRRSHICECWQIKAVTRKHRGRGERGHQLLKIGHLVAGIDGGQDGVYAVLLPKIGFELLGVWQGDRIHPEITPPALYFKGKGQVRQAFEALLVALRMGTSPGVFVVQVCEEPEAGPRLDIGKGKAQTCGAFLEPVFWAQVAVIKSIGSSQPTH